MITLKLTIDEADIVSKILQASNIKAKQPELSKAENRMVSNIDRRICEELIAHLVESGMRKA